MDEAEVKINIAKIVEKALKDKTTMKELTEKIFKELDKLKEVNQNYQVVIKMESEISIKKHLEKAKELYENAVENSSRKNFMYGWVKSLGWVLGEDFDEEDEFFYDIADYCETQQEYESLVDKNS